jgi:exosortase
MTRRRWAILWPWLAALAPWLILFNFLRLEWSADAQYAYGFVVPPLALYLAALRWPSRPAPLPLLRSGWLTLPGIFLCLLLVPLLLLAEASPEWRLIGWGLALVAEGTAFLLLLVRGGWPWVRHFSFPLLFILVAVPWPTSLELKMMLPMMHQDAAASVDLLRWCGVPAIQRQNVIDLPAGSVGVDEACSGIRSLQTSLMIALFVGDWLRLRVGRRVVLLAASVALTYGLNILRTLLLVSLSNQDGAAALTRWHDAAGLAILALSLAGLWGLAILLREDAGRDGLRPASAPGEPAPWPRAGLIALGLWCLVVVAGVETWFDAHEMTTDPASTWTVRWPVDLPTYEPVAIPEEARTSFLYSTADSSAAKWQDAPRLHLWLGYFLSWDAGRETSILASTHHPDVCLPAAGKSLAADYGARTFPAAGVALSGDLYQFDDAGQPLFVFYCVWSNGHAAGAIPASNAKAGTPWWKKLLPFTPEAALDYRLRAIAEGRRNEGQQVLELGVWGARDEREAEGLFGAEIAALVRR